MISENRLEFKKGLGYSLEGYDNKAGGLYLAFKRALDYFEEIPNFYVEDKVKQMFLNTKNKIGYRKLPFTVMFLDCTFVFKGIGNMISNSGEGRVGDEEGFDWLKENQKDINREVTGFLLWNIDTIKSNDDNFLITAIVKTGDYYSLWDANIKGEARKKSLNHIFSVKEKTQIREFICNALDFLNHPEVEVKVVKWRTNEKRIKRGKLPIPDNIEVKITGKLYRHIYEDSPMFPRGVIIKSFWVRGHYIHFWNKNRWKGIYSMDKENLKHKGYQEDHKGIISRWILPYIKGKGQPQIKQYSMNKRKKTELKILK